MTTPTSTRQTVTFVAGLPGSGKSTWLASQANRTALVIDDYKAHAHNDNPAFPASRHLAALRTALADGRSVFVADIDFCRPDAQREATQYIATHHPHIAVNWVCFENDAAACEANVRRSGGRDLAARLEMIRHFRPLYRIPDGAATLPVWKPMAESRTTGCLVTVKRSSVAWPALCPLCASRRSSRALTFVNTRGLIIQSATVPVCHKCGAVICRLQILIGIAAAFALLGAALSSVPGWRMLVGFATALFGGGAAAVYVWRYLQAKAALSFRFYSDGFTPDVTTMEIYCRYPAYAALLAEANAGTVVPVREWLWRLRKGW